VKRREFVTLTGGAAALWSLWLLPLSAQPANRPQRVGILMGIAERDPEGEARIAALQRGLQELGWVDGRNLQFDIRRTAGEPEQLRPLAEEMVQLKPDLIIAVTTSAVAALLQVTRTIPIVFVQVTDPLGSGFISSLARPGGNITGFVTFEFSMGGKWLETLKQAAPRVTRVALIFNPQTAPFSGSFVRLIEAAAPSLAIETTAMPVQNSVEVESKVTAFAAKAGGGLIVLPDLFNTSHRDTIVAAAARHRLPSVYPFRYFATSGGLISDGVDTNELFRRSASYIDRILKGAKPGDLPIQGPSKFELVINLRTAKALGLEIPQMLLARADEVLE
jgi:putative ABC transport system substrate-binding protein